MGWLRLYDELLDDPKVQRLPAGDFKAWVNLLCLANRHDGVLPDEEAIAFALRIDEIACRSLLERLSNAGLIDRLNGGANGSRIAPHGWNKRQYKSDTSTDRVKRFRQRSKTATETPPEAETEAETEETRKTATVVADGGKPPSGGYAFFGRTVKLKPGDLDNWRRRFHAVPDLDAELTAIDAWWQDQPTERRRNWFHATVGMLNRKHQDNLALKVQARSEPRLGAY